MMTSSPSRTSVSVSFQNAGGEIQFQDVYGLNQGELFVYPNLPVRYMLPVLYHLIHIDTV